MDISVGMSVYSVSALTRSAYIFIYIFLLLIKMTSIVSVVFGTPQKQYSCTVVYTAPPNDVYDIALLRINNQTEIKCPKITMATSNEGKYQSVCT